MFQALKAIEKYSIPSQDVGLVPNRKHDIFKDTDVSENGGDILFEDSSKNSSQLKNKFLTVHRRNQSNSLRKKS